MRHTIALLAAATMLSLSVPAFADDQAQQPAAKPMQAAATDKDKKICKTMYHQGSLIRTQMCKTQTEWDFERINAQRGVADFQNRNYQTSSGH